MKTPVMLDGYVQWVPYWRAASCQTVYLYGEEFNTPYCPIEFEVGYAR